MAFMKSQGMKEIVIILRKRTEKRPMVQMTKKEIMQHIVNMMKAK